MRAPMTVKGETFFVFMQQEKVLLDSLWNEDQKMVTGSMESEDLATSTSTQHITPTTHSSKTIALDTKESPVTESSTTLLFISTSRQQDKGDIPHDMQTVIFIIVGLVLFVLVTIVLGYYFQKRLKSRVCKRFESTGKLSVLYQEDAVPMERNITVSSWMHSNPSSGQSLASASYPTLGHYSECSTFSFFTDGDYPISGEVASRKNTQKSTLSDALRLVPTSIPTETTSLSRYPNAIDRSNVGLRKYTNSSFKSFATVHESLRSGTSNESLSRYLQSTMDRPGIGKRTATQSTSKSNIWKNTSDESLSKYL